MRRVLFVSAVSLLLHGAVCLHDYKKIIRAGIRPLAVPAAHRGCAAAGPGSTLESILNIRIYGPGMKEDKNLGSSVSYSIPVQIPEEIACEMLDKLEAQKLVHGEAA